MTNAGGISESLRQHRHMQEMVGIEEKLRLDANDTHSMQGTHTWATHNSCPREASTFLIKLDLIKNQPGFREPRGRPCTTQIQDRNHMI